MLVLIALFGFFTLESSAAPLDGNVYYTDDNGVKRFICPVMGSKGVVESNTKYSDVDGKRYYFCCPGCLPKFEANPSQYIDQLILPGNVVAVSDEATTILCPVSGKEAQMNEQFGFSDYDGSRYYFCCSDCKSKFDQNPSKYTKDFENNSNNKCGNCKSFCR